MNKIYKKPEFSVFLCTDQEVLLISNWVDEIGIGNDHGGDDPYGDAED